MREFFDSEALSMQKGGPEYVYSKDWLGIYWPADEYMFIKLTAEASLQTFYEEAARLLPGMLESPWSTIVAAARRRGEATRSG